MWITVMVLLYGVVLTLLFVYGTNILYLTFLALRHRQRASSRDRASLPARGEGLRVGLALTSDAANEQLPMTDTACRVPTGICSDGPVIDGNHCRSEALVPSRDWASLPASRRVGLPSVTVQLPIYNELYVARRVIEAACRLDYTADHLEIQVLDDSTDETRQVIAALVERYQTQGVRIVHLHRPERDGYKAGALAAGLEQAQGEFIAIFDADFLPPPDFLMHTLPVFADPQVGFVQTRWGHTNADYSLLTRLQAIAIDAHFAIEQYARAQAGYLMNFNGTAGVWRREAIESAGGWRSATLTEDLDLSYRAQFAGWKPAYLRDVVVPGEIPVTLNAFRRQQYRWARGSIECAVRLLPQLWRSPFSLMHKLQGTLHLTGYAIQLLMVLVALLYPFVLHANNAIKPLFALTAIFTLAFLAPTIYFLMGQREIGKSWWRAIPLVLGLNVLGAGMMYHNAGAVLAALLDGNAPEFERTPKFGITEKAHSWGGKAYQLHLSWNLCFEGLMLFYNLNTLHLAVELQNWSIVFFAGLFTLGCAFMLLLALSQSFEQHWQHRIQTRYSQQDI